MRPALFSLFRRILPPVILALNMAIAPADSAADILEVEQSVFGMDCAPCAYGVERSLKKLDGVTEVTVSLNEGLVKMSLAPENRVTLTEIRKRILDNGFTPKDAIVRISGVLDTRTSVPRLTTTGNVEYVLSPAQGFVESQWAELNAMHSGSKVEVRGRVEPGMNEPLAVLVTESRRAH